MRFFMRINDEVVALDSMQLDALYNLLEGSQVVGEEHVGKDMGIEVVDIRARDFPYVDIRDNVILDFKEPDKDYQTQAFAQWQAAGQRGLLNLACGKGKTVVACKCIAHSKTPALVIVHTTTILKQWLDRINQFLSFDGEVGLIRGKPETWDWKRPVTIAMLKTMALYPDAITKEMRRHFGTVWWDEIHHLAADTYCVTADMFPGKRNGLSATLSREDGLQPIYLYHIGRPYYTYLLQEAPTRIYFRETPFTIDRHPDVWEQVTDKLGRVNISKLRTYMGSRDDRNEFQAQDLRDAVAAGRKILALSHSVDQLKLMQEKFPEVSGLCTGRESEKKRWDVLKNKQLIFGTHQLVLEAIDEPSIDMIVWLTPFGSRHPEGGINALQQGMGRGQRILEGKPPLIVLFYHDRAVREFHRMCLKLKQQLSRWPPEKGGPYEFSVIKARQGVDGT